MRAEKRPVASFVFTVTQDGTSARASRHVAPSPDTRVTVELFEYEGKTRMVLTHEGFPSKAHRDGAGSGWPGFLDRIEKLLLSRGT